MKANGWRVKSDNFSEHFQVTFFGRFPFITGLPDKTARTP